MSDCLKLFAAGLLLSIANVSLAIEPLAPPSPSAATTEPPSNGSSLFVGAYGEMIELPYGWAADPTMRGAAEIIHIHRKSIDDFGLKPFHPNSSDYKPENFESMGLIELMVIPKNAPGGFKSLADLRQAKEKELFSSGSEYKISETAPSDDWPKGTFDVATSRPHRLLQMYAESKKEFYILTTAWLPGEAAYANDKRRALNYRYTLDAVGRSLQRHLSTTREHADSGRWFASDENPSTSSSAPNALRIAFVITIPTIAMVCFALWPKKSPRSGKIRLYGRALILFSLTSAIAGFLTVYVPARSWHLYWLHIEDALIIASLPNLMIAWGAARAYGSGHMRRILLSVTALLALWSVIWFFQPRQTVEVSAIYGLYLVPLLLFGLGILVASVFATAFGPASSIKEGK
ncbi:MAG: hypothetical protein COV48_01775 [Elusimicrobia bacterium CG11_big_fil_rev_8_21_14_0_20_64_6]|nr:MAG: hypothetical protein COV48_01775 [Elusimicrobia bacterium CG11_big_fil_rev_8_21_14_0_20_64_6]